MKRVIAAFATLTAIGLTFTACGGDDDDDSVANAGSGGTASTNGNVPCDVDKDNTCQNEQDCPFVVDGTARTTAQTCGKGECLTSDDENCARDCILAELQMSSDCASCYADFVRCTIMHCVGACIADPDSDGCHECQVTEGCRSTFDECSGLAE